MLRLNLATAGALVAVVSALIACFAVGTATAAEFLQGEFWAELEPFVAPEEGTGRWDRGDAAERALEFARRSFSGMVYGYNVTYRPADPDRGVERRSSVDLRGELPWGDRRLTIRDTRETESRLFLDVRYDLDSDQARYRDGFRGASVSRAGGEGSAGIYGGPEALHDALDNAIVDAVHQHARSRYRSRPAEIEARVLLDRPPVFGMSGGSYRVQVRAMVILDTVRAYEVF